MNAFHPKCELFPPVKKGKPFKLQTLEDISLYNGEEYILDLPAGFVSDGASVPKIFWNICPPLDKYLAAAFCHDWYCDLANEEKDYQIRSYGDSHFYSWLKMCGVRDMRAVPMSKSVIVYGKYLKLSKKLN